MPPPIFGGANPFGNPFMVGGANLGSLGGVRGTFCASIAFFPMPTKLGSGGIFGSNPFKTDEPADTCGVFLAAAGFCDGCAAAREGIFSLSCRFNVSERSIAFCMPVSFFISMPLGTLTALGALDVDATFVAGLPPAARPPSPAVFAFVFGKEGIVIFGSLGTFGAKTLDLAPLGVLGGPVVVGLVVLAAAPPARAQAEASSSTTAIRRVDAMAAVTKDLLSTCTSPWK